MGLIIYHITYPMRHLIPNRISIERKTDVKVGFSIYLPSLAKTLQYCMEEDKDKLDRVGLIRRSLRNIRLRRGKPNLSKACKGMLR